MTILKLFLLLATIGSVVAAIIITGNRWWLNTLIKSFYIATALIGLVLTLSAFGVPLGLG